MGVRHRGSDPERTSGADAGAATLHPWPGNTQISLAAQGTLQSGNEHSSAVKTTAIYDRVATLDVVNELSSPGTSFTRHPRHRGCHATCTITWRPPTVGTT